MITSYIVNGFLVSLFGEIYQFDSHLFAGLYVFVPVIVLAFDMTIYSTIVTLFFHLRGKSVDDCDCIVVRNSYRCCCIGSFKAQLGIA